MTGSSVQITSKRWFVPHQLHFLKILCDLNGLLQKLQELSREEALNKRIENGTIDIPPMLFAPELLYLPAYDDSQNAIVSEAAVEEIIRRDERPWSDLEKCIFLDKFLQYPKNFSKIASFLVNKDTTDCVRFYYDSKKDIDFKVQPIQFRFFVSTQVDKMCQGASA